MQTMYRAVSIFVLAFAILLAPTVVSARPPEGPRIPTQEEVLRDWFCRNCIDTYRREAADCFEFWEGNPIMQIRCLTGPREAFMECLVVCGGVIHPSPYEQLFELYDDGLLDSADLVDAIYAINK